MHRHVRRIASLAGFVALLTWTAPGRTQPSAAPHEAEAAAMTQQARKLFKEGVDAFAQSRWADARAAFLAALSLNAHYTIRGNLGAAELKLGRYRDAAEHLARYVREMGEDATSTAAERERGAAMYAEARSKVGTLVVRADVDGARVFVDGTWRGQTPLADPVFVEPGTHTISVEHEGYDTKKMTVQVGAGEEIENGVELQPKSASAPPPKPPVMTLAPPAHGAEERAGGPRTAVLIGGAATAGAAAVAGVVFTVLAVAKGDEAETQREALVRENGPGPCSRASAPATCSTLSDTDDAHIRAANAAILSFAAAGAIGAGTAIYWFATRPSVPQHGVRAMPVVGANGFGVSVSGEF
ncbi:PEGA domain-containing protein [Sorangium sp. So ce1036]|uniref:PEGA domain-containing protein n=1 Tax=Sorangium sp. So ce1036 TaxID=3133328 RepID=UPI003F02A4AA